MATAYEALAATLFKVGQGTILRDNEVLVRILSDAAKEHPKVFGAFRWNPDYQDSKRMREALHLLDYGGAIVRQNAPTMIFQVTSHGSGPAAEEFFEQFGPEDRRAIESVAERIKDAFRPKANAA